MIEVVGPAGAKPEPAGVADPMIEYNVLLRDADVRFNAIKKKYPKLIALAMMSRSRGMMRMVSSRLCPDSDCRPLPLLTLNSHHPSKLVTKRFEVLPCAVLLIEIDRHSSRAGHIELVQ